LSARVRSGGLCSGFGGCSLGFAWFRRLGCGGSRFRAVWCAFTVVEGWGFRVVGRCLQARGLGFGGAPVLAVCGDGSQVWGWVGSGFVGFDGGSARRGLGVGLHGWWLVLGNGRCGYSCRRWLGAWIRDGGWVLWGVTEVCWWVDFVLVRSGLGGACGLGWGCLFSESPLALGPSYVVMGLNA